MTHTHTETFVTCPQCDTKLDEVRGALLIYTPETPRPVRTREDDYYRCPGCGSQWTMEGKRK